MTLIGQREKLSLLDVQQINANYPLIVSNKVDFLLELVGGLENRLAEKDQEDQVKVTQIVAQSNKIEKLERQLVKNDEDNKVRQVEVQATVAAQSKEIEMLLKVNANLEQKVA